jgi:hypothetical protein
MRAHADVNPPVHARATIFTYRLDNGAGLGASHQTGWTGIIARTMHLFATTTAEQASQLGARAAIVEVEPRPKQGGATGARSRAAQ